MRIGDHARSDIIIRAGRTMAQCFSSVRGRISSLAKATSGAEPYRQSELSVYLLSIPSGSDDGGVQVHLASCKRGHAPSPAIFAEAEHGACGRDEAVMDARQSTLSYLAGFPLRPSSALLTFWTSSDYAA